jgi:regulatory protein YycI of two-component signal transduction system YycFG
MCMVVEQLQGKDKVSSIEQTLKDFNTSSLGSTPTPLLSSSSTIELHYYYYRYDVYNPAIIKP